MGNNQMRPWVRAVLLLEGCWVSAHTLNPAKALTQYSTRVWTQQQGLPQDSIRAITQTTDGFLWLGTDEGLARFDGYEFVTFDKDHSNVASNSVILPLLFGKQRRCLQTFRRTQLELV
jgi:ligand-binding sensor domain-containing protein